MQICHSHRAKLKFLYKVSDKRQSHDVYDKQPDDAIDDREEDCHETNDIGSYAYFFLEKITGANFTCGGLFQLRGDWGYPNKDRQKDDSQKNQQALNEALSKAQKGNERSQRYMASMMTF